MALKEERIDRYGGLEGGEYRDARRFCPCEDISPALLPNARLFAGRPFGVE